MLFQPIVTNGNGDVSHQHPPPPNSNAMPESPINLDKIELIELLAKGRYGTVWKALYDDMAYAVKTFCSEVSKKFTKNNYTRALIAEQARSQHFPLFSIPSRSVRRVCEKF